MADNISEGLTEGLELSEAEQTVTDPRRTTAAAVARHRYLPFMIVPLFVSRDRSIRAVDEALGEHRMILLACQKDLDKEEPQQDDLHQVGTVGGNYENAEAAGTAGFAFSSRVCHVPRLKR